MAVGWSAERLLAILNSLPGEKPAKKLKDRKTAVARIWARIQGLGEAAKPEAAPAKPKARKKAKGGARSAKGAPTKAKPTNKATPAKAAPKVKKTAKAQEAAGPREGSKTAQVIALLQRAKGASITEIMDEMGWQSHTVRGFVAGAMKKAGYTVESFKPEGVSAATAFPSSIALPPLARPRYLPVAGFFASGRISIPRSIVLTPTGHEMMAADVRNLVSLNRRAVNLLPLSFS